MNIQGFFPRRFALVVVPMFSMIASTSAAPIVIDDFTINQGTFSGASSAPADFLTDGMLFSDLLVTGGSFGGFQNRYLQSYHLVGAGNGVVFSGSAAATGNGTLTLRHAKGGFPLVTGANPVSLTRLVYQGPVDLTAGGSNNALRFVFSGVSVSGLAPVATVEIRDSNLTGVYSGPLLPTTTVGSTTVDIPFSAFTNSSLFSALNQLTFQFENNVFGGAARSAEYVLTNISAVPEPSTYAMALAGIACGGYSMFRCRKRA
jgi:hypothetical protein